MEEMMIITSIVVMVFGILQIVLFFKLWGMTNNIRWIKRNIDKQGEERDREISKAIQKRNPDLSSQIFDYVYNDFYAAYQESKYLGFPSGFKTALQKAERVYEKANIEMPEIFGKISSCKDFDSYFRIPM